LLHQAPTDLFTRWWWGWGEQVLYTMPPLGELSKMLPLPGGSVLSDFSVAWRVMSDGRRLVALTFLPDGPRPDLVLYSGELPRMFLVVLFT
jgi:hypothetical protein